MARLTDSDRDGQAVRLRFGARTPRHLRGRNPNQALRRPGWGRGLLVLCRDADP